jgi:hypothetical protein
MNQVQLNGGLHQATVAVQYVNEPKGRAISGSIKDTDGIYYGVPKNMLGMFRPGENYVIEFAETNKDGVTYRNVKATKPVQQQARPATPVPQNNTIPGDYDVIRSDLPRNGSMLLPSNGPITAPPAPRIAPQPQAQPQSNGHYRPTHPRDAKRMFLTATLGHFIETGRVDCNAQAIADAIVEIAAAYDHTIGREDA